MANPPVHEQNGIQPARLGPVADGVRRTIGSGYTSLRFRQAFELDTDPILMLEHFVMTGTTFAPHLHQGIATVTALFEDSQGSLLNRDTVGASVDLQAGDLYRLAAGSGAVHEQRPSAGARIHALQLFVKLPAALHRNPARAFLVRSADVPLVAGGGYRVRTVPCADSDNGGSAGTEMTLLDCSLQPGGQFVHRLPGGRKAWLYVVSGRLDIRITEDGRMLEAGQMITVAPGEAVDVAMHAAMATHFFLIAADPVRMPGRHDTALQISAPLENIQSLATPAAAPRRAADASFPSPAIEELP